METTTTTPMIKAKKQSRKRPLPPAVNSRNLAIEKRRRQDMNRIFLDLARCVPSLAPAKRLTKNLIVMESLQHIRRQRDMCITAGRELRELLSAHHESIAEINALRSQLGMPARNSSRSPSAAFFALMEVENQTYGEFPDGFAHPSTLENRDSQSPRNHTHTAQSLVPQTQACAPDGLLNFLDEPCNMIPQENWQTQPPGQFFCSSNVQRAPPPNSDWLSMDVSGVDSENSWEDLPTHTLSWEEACSSVLQQYSGDNFGSLLRSVP